MADLGTLFVRIEADTANFNRGVDDAKGKTDNLSKSAQGGTKSIAALAAGIGAAVIAFRALSQLVGQSVQLYGRQIQAETRLAAAVRATDGDVRELIPQYTALAGEIQELTTTGDEAALELIQLGTSLGISSDKIEEATKGAIGLSTAFGINAQTAVRAVANAFNGNFEQLQRYIPALRTTTDESEKLRIVQEAMANGFDLAKAEAQTSFGAIQQYKNAIGDLQEELGRGVAEGIEPFVRTLTTFVQRVADSTRETNRFNNIIRNLRDGVDDQTIGIDEYRNALERLRAEEELILREAGETQGADRLRVIREEIALTERQISELNRQADAQRILNGFTQRGAENARRQAEASGILADAVAELEERRIAALTPAERELELLQERINLLVEEQAQVSLAFGRESESSATLNRLLAELVERRRELREEIAGTNLSLDEQSELLNEVQVAGTEASTALLEDWKNYNEEQEKAAENLRILTQEYEAIAITIAGTFAPVLEDLGEALSGVEDGWVSLGQTAVKSIAVVIRSLARQFAAQSAGAFAAGNIPGGTALAGAAGAAFVAAGIVNGLASQIQKAALGADFVTNGPQLLMVGDNPGGRERVSVEPLSSPNINGPDGAPLYVQINLDGQVMSKFVTKAIRNNRILVDARAVV